MAYDYEKEIVPKFLRTKHLPFYPNARRDDLIASEEEVLEAFNSNFTITIEEKVDGANCGITFNRQTGEPVIRNRNHILSKGYSRKNTPAKNQFAPIWTWWYSNEYKIKELAKLLGFIPTIYGEWLYARHSVSYDLLPDYFVAFDIYRPEDSTFLAPQIYRSALKEVGFSIVPLIFNSNSGIKTERLIEFREEISSFSSTARREGLYLKVSDEDKVVGRFKMVRPDFITDDNWNKKELIKNKLIKSKT